MNTGNITLTIVTVTKNDLENLLMTCHAIDHAINGLKNEAVEHLVVDGNSTDGTKQFLETRGQKFISEPDTGIYNAMNKGAKMAKGQYILFMNAGDLPIHLAATIKSIAKSVRLKEGVFVFIGRVVYRWPKTLRKPKVSKRKRLVGGSLLASHQAFIYKRSTHDIAGLYNERLKSASDYQFMNRSFMKLGMSRVVFMDNFCCIRQKSKSDSSNTFRHAIEMFTVGLNYKFSMFAMIYLATAVLKSGVANCIRR